MAPRCCLPWAQAGRRLYFSTQETTRSDRPRTSSVSAAMGPWLARPPYSGPASFRISRASSIVAAIFLQGGAFQNRELGWRGLDGRILAFNGEAVTEPFAHTFDARSWRTTDPPDATASPRWSQIFLANRPAHMSPKRSNCCPLRDVNHDLRRLVRVTGAIDSDQDLLEHAVPPA